MPQPSAPSAPLQAGKAGEHEPSWCFSNYIIPRGEFFPFFFPPLRSAKNLTKQHENEGILHLDEVKIQSFKYSQRNIT